MTRYVCGFAFDQNYSRVLLIHKQHGPPAVVGKLNGLGGKIEPGETIAEAMDREFLEEAGEAFASRLEVIEPSHLQRPIDKPNHWRHFLTLEGEDWSVEFLRGFLTSWPSGWVSPTDEPLYARPLPLGWMQGSFPREVRNLSWIIPMALDFHLTNATVRDRT